MWDASPLLPCFAQAWQDHQAQYKTAKRADVSATVTDNHFAVENTRCAVAVTQLGQFKLTRFPDWLARSKARIWLWLVVVNNLVPAFTGVDTEKPGSRS
jgi:hypothetical protein